MVMRFIGAEFQRTNMSGSKSWSWFSYGIVSRSRSGNYMRSWSGSRGGAQYWSDIQAYSQCWSLREHKLI